jgi:hypothetical protein
MVINKKKTNFPHVYEIKTDPKNKQKTKVKVVFDSTLYRIIYSYQHSPCIQNPFRLRGY